MKWLSKFLHPREFERDANIRADRPTDLYYTHNHLTRPR